MGNEIVLRPEELYFLGTVMNAEYIDYGYIASMHEIQRNYELTKKRCMLDLARSGIIRERLGGEITVRPQPEKLLRNVFFGRLETTLDVVTIGEQTRRTTRRFHHLDGSITMVTENAGTLTVSPVTELETRILADVGRHTETPRPLAQLRKESVTKVIAAKRAAIGAGSTDLLLFEQGGGLYTLDSTGKPEGIPNRKACEMLLTILKGE